MPKQQTPKSDKVSLQVRVEQEAYIRIYAEAARTRTSPGDIISVLALAALPGRRAK